ncbi:MAG: hypothetical protein SFY92_02655 [Verrucomicrobiae bacterium]|nr:hypothetical protein [Verrucomicrobiae bacterium]
MRNVTRPGLAELKEGQQKEMLEQHIPYRLSLLRDGFRPSWIQPCQHTNQAFEAGAISGRILLSFLGIGYNNNSGRLTSDREHKKYKGGLTDDVKAPDVGGHFVEVDNLAEPDKDTLAFFIQGVHKACAHFTIDSNHQLTLENYAEAGAIIFRLMAQSFPNHSSSWPKWSS